MTYEATRCRECNAPAVVAVTPVGRQWAFGLCAAHQATFERTTRLSYYLRPTATEPDDAARTPEATNA